MEEELNSISTQPAQEVQETQPVQDSRKRYPWYYVKRFDRYIIKHFLGTFFFAILLLFAIVVMFDINEKLDAVLTAPLKATVFQYFMNFLPFVLSQFSPLFTFIAVIFFTSRLADRSEVIAMLSNGISFYRLTVPVLGCGDRIGQLPTRRLHHSACQRRANRLYQQMGQEQGGRLW